MTSPAPTHSTTGSTRKTASWDMAHRKQTLGLKRDDFYDRVGHQFDLKPVFNFSFVGQRKLKYTSGQCGEEVTESLQISSIISLFSAMILMRPKKTDVLCVISAKN